MLNHARYFSASIFKIFIYLLFLIALGLHCYVQSFCLVVMNGATLCCSEWASHCSGFSLQSTGSRRSDFSSWHTGSVVVVRRISYSTGGGIFLDRGSNLCPLHWQYSYPLHHHGGPFFCICWDDRMIAIFHPVNVVCHVYWFAYVEPCLHPRHNPTWAWCMILLMCCWIQFVFCWEFLYLYSSVKLAYGSLFL